MGRVLFFRDNIPSTQEALETYLSILRGKGRAETTLKSIRDFLSVLIARHRFSFQDPAHPFLAYLSEARNPHTYNLRLSYSRAFFAWCIDQGFMVDNPADGFRKRKTESRVVRVAMETIEALLRAPDRKTFAGSRDFALILLTLDTGIRPREALALRAEDVDLRAMEARVRAETAKTRVSRTLPFSFPTQEGIRDFLKCRPRGWSAPLFCSYEGKALTVRAWEDRMERYGNTIGTRVLPYDLRHSFALYFLRNGGDALTLQRIMGHTDLAMTKRYIAMSQEETRAIHEKASPVIGVLGRRERIRKIEGPCR